MGNIKQIIKSLAGGVYCTESEPIHILLLKINLRGDHLVAMYSDQNILSNISP